MKIKDVANIINGNIICGESLLNVEVERGFASDLMSDVLTLDMENVLLITGLANLQAIRTAEMSDSSCIVFARKKKVTKEMIELAKESNIALIECKSSVFKTAGKLYAAGVNPVY